MQFAVAATIATTTSLLIQSTVDIYFFPIAGLLVLITIVIIVLALLMLRK